MSHGHNNTLTYAGSYAQKAFRLFIKPPSQSAICLYKGVMVMDKPSAPRSVEMGQAVPALCLQTVF